MSRTDYELAIAKGFEPGLRVVAINNQDSCPIEGKTGTIISVSPETFYAVGVEFDEDDAEECAFHNLNGQISNYMGYYVQSRNLDWYSSDVPPKVEVDLEEII